MDFCVTLFIAEKTSQRLSFFRSNHVAEKGYSSLLSFTVTDINTTVTKLMALGAELDGTIKYEIHGKVTISYEDVQVSFHTYLLKWDLKYFCGCFFVLLGCGYEMP